MQSPFIYVYPNEKERAPYIVGVEVGGFSQPIWDNRVDDQVKRKNYLIKGGERLIRVK